MTDSVHIPIETVKFEHQRMTVETWPDGSRIQLDMYREDPIAPWIYGNYEVYCGTCADKIAEVHGDSKEARIKYLEHALADIQTALIHRSFTARSNRDRT